MIKKIIEWIKLHKFQALIVAVIGYFAYQWLMQSGIMYNLRYGGATMQASPSYVGDFGMALPSSTSYEKSANYNAGYGGATYDAVQNSVTTSSVSVKSRMVSKNYSISAVGKEVKETAEKITTQVESLGGFVVSNSVKEYQSTANAYITARVPAEKAKEFIASVKSNVVKVVTLDENASDITDQYSDTKENLRLLEETKVRFEEIWKASTKTQDMLSTLREIQNIQMEIDRLKGQEKYYEELAKYSYFNINLSKDEMDLPYMPDESWSAEFVFKSAVRELVTAFRGIAAKVIWIVVFAVIWVPAFAIAFFVFKKYKKQIVG